MKKKDIRFLVLKHLKEQNARIFVIDITDFLKKHFKDDFNSQVSTVNIDFHQNKFADFRVAWSNRQQGEKGLIRCVEAKIHPAGEEFLRKELELKGIAGTETPIIT
ncbi:hypothetical protein [Flavobacterium silvaticum]|uniref:Uncharacterized protein n=1 Tax=Flavobacterium silvaticum TaxID=1852020 RepID=A0A972G126_9FLAO|nr:hypothetical protein [Flavobacterium silvaticum]NMH28491.1 hypothetical protein [Flavobacterium silvaticum]